MNVILSEFAKWDSFYVIVGSASGALIGSQFVVLTLIAERPELRESGAGSAFATPTIVHFSAAFRHKGAAPFRSNLRADGLIAVEI